MTRTYTIAAVILCTVFLAAGLAQAEEPAKNVEPYVATFPYTPPPEKAPNSQGITVAVAKTAFFPCEVSDELWLNELKITGKIDGSTDKMFWFAFPQFYNLAGKLRKDIAELLFAKGFRVRGPYASYEEIPPTDRNAVNFYFIPKMALTFTLHDKTKRGYSNTDIEVNGTITLEVQDMATREPLWTINVPLERIVFTSRIQMPYHVDDKFNSIMNEVVKGIDQQYPTLMNSVSGHLDPQEIRALKKSGKGKTGY
ncbi:MAG: hypothetical protein WC683_00715 [bacterium]